jgi:hypothetical protein
MKLRICVTNGQPKLVLVYKPGEWEVLRSQWERLGLQEYETNNLWGMSMRGKVYRDPEGRMEQLLHDLFDASDIRYRFFSDINSPLYRGSRVNVGILRVVPDENFEVHVPLPKFITIDELVVIRDTLASAVRLILSVAVESECEIKFIINGKEVE